MNPLIIIPARRDSTRFPDKLLQEVRGKPVIRWTVEAAERTGFPVIVATDCREIIEAADTHHILTGPHLNGTERCIAAARHPNSGLLASQMIINWQGDSPTTRPEWVRQLVKHMESSPCAVGTLHQCTSEYDLSRDGEVALYQLGGIARNFARYGKGQPMESRHLGVYAIRQTAFGLYGMVPSQNEIYDGLEQQRWLDRGVAIAACEVPSTVEINHEADLGLFATWLESIDAIV